MDFGRRRNAVWLPAIFVYERGPWNQPYEAELENKNLAGCCVGLFGGRQWSLLVDTQQYYDLPGASGEPTGWFDENLDADPFSTGNIWLDEPIPLDVTEYVVQPYSIIVVEEGAGAGGVDTTAMMDGGQARGVSATGTEAASERTKDRR